MQSINAQSEEPYRELNIDILSIIKALREKQVILQKEILSIFGDSEEALMLRIRQQVLSDLDNILVESQFNKDK